MDRGSLTQSMVSQELDMTGELSLSQCCNSGTLRRQ